MTRTYTSITVRASVRFAPGWQPNLSAELPYKERFAAPEHTITRELGDPAYTVTHVDSGESVEVPSANVRSATPSPAPKPAAPMQKKGGGK